MKKTRLFIIGLIIIIIAFIISFVISLQKMHTPQPKPTFVPQKISNYQTIIYEENKKYTISFFPQSNSYSIIILGIPFETYKQEAEQKFLEVTKLTTSQACLIKVIVGTPTFVNPAESVKAYRLSFCNNPSPTPIITIDPALPPLIIQQFYPPEGPVEMGGSTTGVFVTFSQPINLSTVLIDINPAIAFKTALHPKNKAQLIVVPTEEWKSNISYVITIKQGVLTEKNDAQLKENVVVKYESKEVVLPPDIPEEF